MATADFTPAEIAKYKLIAETTAKINDASQKEAQNNETISELAKKILDLGGIVPPLEKPDIKENPNSIIGRLTRQLDSLQQKIQWQEKIIQQYGELIANKNRSN